MAEPTTDLQIESYFPADFQGSESLEQHIIVVKASKLSFAEFVDFWKVASCQLDEVVLKAYPVEDFENEIESFNSCLKKPANIVVGEIIASYRMAKETGLEVLIAAEGAEGYIAFQWFTSA